MKIISQQNALLQNAIGTQSFDKNVSYRFIKYLVELKCEDGHLWFNTLTRQMILLTENEYNALKENRYDSLYEKLVNLYFLVPDGHDDKKLYEQIKNLYKILSFKKGITNYLILPTTDCNARCFYCFEHGAKRYHMTKDIANDVADYIIKNSFNQKIKIMWFGGEPLYNIEPINIITKKLSDANIQFSSQMISNGYLFDEKLVYEAKKNWHLKRVQITLDGTEERYNRIKKYIYREDDSPFQTVINNIELLLKAEVNVGIRINIGKQGKDDFLNLIDLLHKRFYDYNKRLFIYPALLYESAETILNAHDEDDLKQLIFDVKHLENYIFEKGFAYNDIPNKQITLNACIADNENSVIVLPNGRLGKCDHYTDKELFGDIYSNEKDAFMIESWKELREPVELCETCPLFPQCLNLKKCPHLGPKCNIYIQQQKLEKLQLQMKNAYYKSKQ